MIKTNLGGAESMGEVSGRELTDFTLPNIDHRLVGADSSPLVVVVVVVVHRHLQSPHQHQNFPERKKS